MRHNLADDGTSHTGPLAKSPDIIVKNNPVANPQAAFSTPASISSDTESDPTVLNTQDNYLYLRVWNRGLDATNVTATAYWSTPATLVTPNMWSLIGSVQFSDVPAGRVVKAADPGLAWPQASIPGSGHYCFVATVGNAADPAAAPNSFATFDDFVRYIYAHNNITWRNVDVVGNAPHGHPRFGGFVPLPFRIPGAWDKARVFELEIVSELPQGSRMALQVPQWLGRGLEPAHEEVEEHEDADTDPDDVRRLRIRLHGHHTT